MNKTLFLLSLGVIGLILAIISLCIIPSTKSVEAKMIKDSTFVATLSDTIQKGQLKKRRTDSVAVWGNMRALEKRVNTLEKQNKELKAKIKQNQAPPKPPVVRRQIPPRNTRSTALSQKEHQKDSVTKNQKPAKQKPFNCKAAILDLQKRVERIDSAVSRLDSLAVKNQ
jgi:hypothetical protein